VAFDGADASGVEGAEDGTSLGEIGAIASVFA
jgi:hypothetical protein